MAKKKSESEETTPAKKTPAAKKPAAKKEPVAAEAATAAPKPAAKKSAKSAKPSAPMQTPLIDTNLAAQTAAAMILNRGANASTPSAGSQESSSFKSFKEGLNKPAIAGLGGILGTGGGQKKLGNSFGGNKSAGPGAARNQTFGADVSRSGVPRRTGG